MAYYLDTSALVKLVVDGPETAALRRWLGEVDRSLTAMVTYDDHLAAAAQANGIPVTAPA